MKKILLTLLVLTGISAYASNITGPRYRVEGGLGLGTILTLGNAHVNFMPEWEAQITNDFDITFGPKISVGGSIGIIPVSDDMSTIKVIPVGNITANISFEGDFNIKVPNTKNKFYVGLEAGAGVGPYIAKGNVIAVPNFIGKLTLGGKLNDKTNVGVYLGYGKGIIGVELGHTFK